ncbi:hypothetical protein ACFX2F_015372 [Malus domestica]
MNSESGAELVSTQDKESAVEGEPAASQPVELSKLGKEFKASMQEKEGNFFSRVVEEVRDIEWPAFAKVELGVGLGKGCWEGVGRGLQGRWGWGGLLDGRGGDESGGEGGGSGDGFLGWFVLNRVNIIIF